MDAAGVGVGAGLAEALLESGGDVVPLIEAVDLDPRDNASRYNIACCHALLQHGAQAITQLRLCLENDSRGSLLESARTDPDFASLRNRLLGFAAANAWTENGDATHRK